MDRKPPTDPTPVAAALERRGRPRLVFAIDATASREPAWEAAKATTDSLFHALPGQLDVALAVHGGVRLKVLSDFVAESSALRDVAAGVGATPARRGSWKSWSAAARPRT